MHYGSPSIGSSSSIIVKRRSRCTIATHPRHRANTIVKSTEGKTRALAHTLRGVSLQMHTHITLNFVCARARARATHVCSVTSLSSPCHTHRLAHHTISALTHTHTHSLGTAYLALSGTIAYDATVK